MRRLAIFSFSFGAAALCAALLPLDGALWLLGALALAAALLTGLPHGSKKARLAVRWGAMGLAAGFLWTAGYTALFWRPAQALDDRTVRLSGTVAEWPQEREYGWSVLVRMETEGPAVPTLLFADSQAAQLRPGDRVETVAHCTLADRSRAGEEITYYTAKGILITAQGYGLLSWERPEAVPLRDRPALWSRALKDSIDRSFPGDAAPLVKALVTGNRDSLTDPFTTSLQRTGLSHTVAVSGMHLAFLAGLVSLLLGASRRLTALVLIPMSALFCLVAGCTPSVVRAAIMIVLLQLAPLFRRERDDCTALGTALLLLLLWNPYSAAHIGLQLSFAAVAGILLCAGKVQRGLLALLPKPGAGKGLLARAGRRVLYFTASTCGATVGASLLTTPLVALYFDAVPLISPLSNLLTLWAVGLLFGAGLCLGTLGLLLPRLAALGAVPAALLARYLDGVIQWLAGFPFSSVTMGPVYYRAWIVLVYLLALSAFLLPGRKRWTVSVCCGISALCLAMVLSSWSFWRGPGAVTALDVGQGESILVRSGGFLTLVDCGGSGYENAGDTVAGYLGDFGVRRLDLLVVTHFHNDHANGVARLLERMEVGLLALPDVDQESPIRQELLSAAERTGTEVRFIRSDTALELDVERTVRLFAPLGAGETNEEGLSVLASQGDFDALITGDMGADVERALLARTELPRVEVLAVGHHGSQYSTGQELLERIRPEIALISVGKHNSYGHPDPGTVERLLAAGTEVYRTDLHGTVTVRRNEA